MRILDCGEVRTEARVFFALIEEMKSLWIKVGYGGKQMREILSRTDKIDRWIEGGLGV